MQNDFPKTNAAMTELEDVLSHAEKIAEHKREQLKQRQSNNDQRLSASFRKNEKLKNTVSDAADNVQKIINHLDKVLSENGTGNN